MLALDLPGHGESPDQLPHSMQHIVGLIHQAVEEAGLETPVMIGHSIAGGFASVYAGQHPTRGVVNVDALPDPALFSLLRSREEQIRGDGFPGVWALMKQSFGTDLLPVSARHLVAHNSRPRQDLVVSYWDELLRRPRSVRRHAGRFVRCRRGLGRPLPAHRGSRAWPRTSASGSATHCPG